MSERLLIDEVRDQYEGVAKGSLSDEREISVRYLFCKAPFGPLRGKRYRTLISRPILNNESTAVRTIAAAFGYSEAELNQLPTEANMGLSCGNPLALAGIREGEVVVDLGCGGTSGSC